MRTGTCFAPRFSTVALDDAGDILEETRQKGNRYGQSSDENESSGVRRAGIDLEERFGFGGDATGLTVSMVITTFSVDSICGGDPQTESVGVVNPNSAGGDDSGEELFDRMYAEILTCICVNCWTGRVL